MLPGSIHLITTECNCQLRLRLSGTAWAEVSQGPTKTFIPRLPGHLSRQGYWLALRQGMRRPSTALRTTYTIPRGAFVSRSPKLGCNLGARSAW